MGLLVYKFSDYSTTHEREHYRALCNSLRDYYNSSKEWCIFLANYNIYDTELDGLIIKQDAIIGVELKKHGGEIHAEENGQWTAGDGSIIKGGSGKSVYQQAKVNHISIRKGMKAATRLSSKQLSDISALIVFQKPITKLYNNLGPATQCWLHITDTAHFIEKVQDITTDKLYLEPNDMLRLIDELALNEDYLDEQYSNPEMLTMTFDDEPEDETAEGPAEPADIQRLDEKRQGLRDFVEKILKQIFKRDDCCIRVFLSQDVQPLLSTCDLTLSHEYLVTVDAEGIGASCQKLSRFVNHEVHVINSNQVCWEDGDFTDIKQKGEEKTTDGSLDFSVADAPTKVAFRKSKTVLPHWLDKKIFEEYHAIYAPEHERFEYNLDLTSEELKVYLGTYFPRSYAEMFCIVDNLMQNKTFAEIIQSEEQINVFDCGCGTGGEILGLITALAKHLSQVTINVTAIDGNEGALAILKELAESNQSCNVKLRLTTLCQTFSTYEDLMKLGNGKKNSHFVLCDKMICELISKQVLSNDAYAIMTKLLASHLNDKGLLIMLDVTTKDEHTGFFYPQLMNNSINEYARKDRTIKTLLPLSCAFNEGCNDFCFMQQTFCVSHSRKSADESRVCYRVLCRKPLKDIVLQNVKTEGIAYIIHPKQYKQNDVSATCRQTKDNQIIIDSFNINL